MGQCASVTGTDGLREPSAPNSQDGRSALLATLVADVVAPGREDVGDADVRSRPLVAGPQAVGGNRPVQDAIVGEFEDAPVLPCEVARQPLVGHHGDDDMPELIEVEDAAHTSGMGNLHPVHEVRVAGAPRFRCEAPRHATRER